jgi:hypothetical protein
MDNLGLLHKEISINNLSNIIGKNFIENIEIQEGKFNSFTHITKKIKELHTHEYVSTKNGKVVIDIERMRDLIVKIQKKYITADNEFPDPCGMIFYKNQNELVTANDLILTYRVGQNDLELFRTELEKIITIID